MDEEAKELLKQVLALHGNGGHGYPTQLLDRFVPHNGNVDILAHHVDTKELLKLDKKIQKYLDKK